MTDGNARDAHASRVADGVIVIEATAAGAPSLCLETFPATLADEFGVVFAGMTPWADYGYPAERLASYFAGREPGAPRYLIRTGGEAAGVMGLRNHWLRGPYLQFLGIVPEFQNQAIGGVLLAWWEGHARSRGERNLWLTVSEVNERARAFYGRNGFVETSRLPDLVVGGWSEILLRKRLIGS